MEKKLTMLMILDGFGENPKKEGNAVKLAKTYLFRVWQYRRSFQIPSSSDGSLPLRPLSRV